MNNKQIELSLLESMESKAWDYTSEMHLRAVKLVEQGVDAVTAFYAAWDELDDASLQFYLNRR